ncbi:helix-turn-helix domain-containing protein [Sphingomonas adhaesiva]|uniref:helix-turn-helix domain-containing protein n=1 Tax=Sphingomonas adhaesiva TaxID=28212 RepID=UPI002FF7FA0D
MKLSSVEFPGGRKVFAQAIRGIRRKRDLKTSEVAERMDLPLRTYELFEAGGGRLSPDRVRRFAEATDSDPFAIVLSIAFGDAEFAIACADTKLALILVMHLQGFFEDRGSDLAYLDPPNIIGAFERIFKELGSKLDDNEAFLQRWFDDGPARSASDRCPFAASAARTDRYVSRSR